jgi:hypothetical protein
MTVDVVGIPSRRRRLLEHHTTAVVFNKLKYYYRAVWFEAFTRRSETPRRAAGTATPSAPKVSAAVKQKDSGQHDY